MTLRNWWPALLAVVLTGCGDSAKPTANAPAGGGAPSNPTIAATGDDDAAKPLSEEDLAGIKKLPDEADQKAAIEQKLCPITGSHLGSMGQPLKKVVDGKPVFLCCGGCEREFDADPKAALAKLAKK